MYKYIEKLEHFLCQVGNFIVMNLLPVVLITAMNYSIYNILRRWENSQFFYFLEMLDLESCLQISIGVLVRN